MNKYRTAAIYTGVFFLISDVASIAALLLFQPLLKNADFITSSGISEPLILLGTVLEILTAFAAAATALVLYPILRKQSQSMALGYVIFRALEAAMILIGVLCVLAVLALRTNFLASAGDPAIYQVVAGALIAIKNWSFVFGPNIILAVNATILGYLLLQSKLVPRTIALLALIDGPVILTVAILVLFGVVVQDSPIQILSAMPMLAFEVSFSLYLIIKGFKSEAIETLEAKN